MGFYGERFRRPNEKDIWEELRQMLINQPSEQEIALKEQQEQAEINSVLEKMFSSNTQKSKIKEPYLKYEDLFDKPKTLVSKSNNKALSQKRLDNFGQKVFRGLDKIKEQNPLSNLENIMQKGSNNNSLKNTTTSDKNLTWQEKAFDKLLQNKTTVRGHFPVAADMYTDARTGFSRAKANKNATVLENMNSLDSKTKEALKNYGVSSNERGVYYNANSNVSKKFGKSSELKRAFDENYQEIKDGKFKGYDLNFDAKPLDAIINKDKFDRHSSIQHAKLYDAYIDEKGQKRASVLDKVDYNKRPDGTLKDKIKNYPNNHGHSLQEKGALENYFTIMDINVEDDDWLDKLRKKLKL